MLFIKRFNLTKNPKKNDIFQLRYQHWYGRKIWNKAH